MSRAALLGAWVLAALVAGVVAAAAGAAGEPAGAPVAVEGPAVEAPAGATATTAVGAAAAPTEASPADDGRSIASADPSLPVVVPVVVPEELVPGPTSPLTVDDFLTDRPPATAPSLPTFEAVPAEGTDPASSVRLTGRGCTGAEVQLHEDGTALRPAEVLADGSWSSSHVRRSGTQRFDAVCVGADGGPHFSYEPLVLTSP